LLGGHWGSLRERAPMLSKKNRVGAPPKKSAAQEFEIGTLSRVSEGLVRFGCELVARGRGRGGVSRRRRRRARAVHRHGNRENWGRQNPPIKRGGVGRCSVFDM